MTYLLDTNIISEVRKGDRCDRNVASWYGSLDDSDLYLSVLVLAEIRKGAELVRRRDPTQARALESWLIQVADAFGERVLPVDRAVADTWGRMAAVRPISVVDGLLAATAKVHHLVLVTRDADGVAGLGADVLNPF